MSRIRVLIVDDAVVIRRLVGDVLAADPEIEVVGTAANGRIGLQKIAQTAPDVVTMDVEMPDMDGIATVRELRRTWPRLPVIMFSTLTERGAAATLDALSAGASDYVTKPANVGSVTAGLDAVRRDLIPKIKALAGRAPAGAPALVPPRPVAAAPARLAPVPTVPTAGPAGPVELVTIGVSTGGPNALATVLPALPASLPVPVLVVQHMPPMFTRLLADRLNTQCAVDVVEAAAGMPVRPGCVYIAPGDFHMTVVRKRAGALIALNQEPHENSCRPAVDVLFRSAAAEYGARVLGVILTGMGQDGLRGAGDLCGAGGRVVAQDEATSVVWGMPGFVARAGLAERVLPLDAVAPEIVRRVTTAASVGGSLRAAAGPLRALSS